MAEADKLNIDSIIQRLLEGKAVFRSIFIHRGSHFSRQRLDNDSLLSGVKFISRFFLTRHRIWVVRAACLSSSTSARSKFNRLRETPSNVERFIFIFYSPLSKCPHINVRHCELVSFTGNYHVKKRLFVLLQIRCLSIPVFFFLCTKFTFLVCTECIWAVRSNYKCIVTWKL